MSPVLCFSSRKNRNHKNTLLFVVSASSEYEDPLTWTGARGPPQYAITRAQLAFLLSYGFRAAQIGEILSVSLSTVKR